MTTMNELLFVSIPLTAGLVLGAFFFGGLWWTVNQAVSSKRPAVWLLGGKLLRMGVVLGGFYLVGGARWERWLLCLLGFVMARVGTWWLTRSPTQNRAGPTPEAHYAP
jgi:F1F0 ATPase subunit 2